MVSDMQMKSLTGDKLVVGAEASSCRVSAAVEYHQQSRVGCRDRVRVGAITTQLIARVRLVFPALDVHLKVAA